MKLEETIVNLEKLIALFHAASEQNKMVDYSKIIETLEFALTAIRPVSREQVEKVWRGEWIIQQGEHKEYIKRCSKCGFPISGWWDADKFCANCGAPMTDEAVEMVMERLEALRDET